MTDGVPNVALEGVSVGYHDSHAAASLKQLVTRRRAAPADSSRKWALRDITLSVDAGEILGVIGHNGSGKSTLLRTIAGVMPPTQGRVVVRGSVTPILDMGVGLHPDATGRDSIIFFGALLGRDPQVMRGRATEIADWAGLQNYLDRPLRAYSAGMSARLSFAVVTDVTADVLLIDEVLSVGDAAFQLKSLERVHEITRSGSAVIIVSHDVLSLRKHCDRILWLDSGRAQRLGDPEQIVGEYLEAFVRAQIP